MRRELYTPDWEAVSLRIRARSGGQCECTGHCGLHRGRRCVERNGEPAVWMRRRICEECEGQGVKTSVSILCGACEGRGWHPTIVVLTVHHLNFDKQDNRDENLLAACQRCHLRADAPLRAERHKMAQDLAAGQSRFWPLSIEGKPEHAR